MRKFFLPFIALLMVFISMADADVVLTSETEALLPDGVHRVTLPAGMLYQIPDPEEKELKGVFLRTPDLEMLVFAYDAQGKSLETYAASLQEAGRTVELRTIAGEDFLVYFEKDETDGAYCIGYCYMYQGWMIELSFFYASQEAADLSTIIMESFH